MSLEATSLLSPPALKAMQIAISNWLLPGIGCALIISVPAAASSAVDAVYPSAQALYVELDRRQELSGREIRTAAKLAAQLRALGYDVTENLLSLS